MGLRSYNFLKYFLPGVISAAFYSQSMKRRPEKPASISCQNWMLSSPYFQHRYTSLPSCKATKSINPMPQIFHLNSHILNFVQELIEAVKIWKQFA